jgi:ABC-type branched-subunit amino acid transport system permease subunit
LIRPERSSLAFGFAALVLLAAGPFLPQWLTFALMVSIAKALVVVGLLILMRAGLVSFGQGLYYCLGGYAAGVANNFWGVNDVLALLAFGVVLSGAVAAILGLLLARYREIFFAMFTMAFSMILYGVLSKTPALGSTDGFNVKTPSLLGYALPSESAQLWIYGLAVVVALVAAILVQRYLRSGMGFAGESIRENEIRVEYLGISARRLVYVKYVLAAILASLGGGLTAIGSGHVDPQMAYWTTSGEFVFIALMGGTGHVGAAFVGSILFELIRTYAFELSPYTWQMALGVALLAIILFLPKGLWSLAGKR